MPFQRTPERGLSSPRIWSRFGSFARQWEFNSALFGLLTNVLEAFETKLILGLAFARYTYGNSFWIWSTARVTARNDADTSIPRGDWLYGALLVVSPVINPYLLWLLPFAAIFPSAWAWTASLAVLLSYVTGLNLNEYAMQPYQQAVWARPLEFAMILLALGYDLFRHRRSKLNSMRS